MKPKGTTSSPAPCLQRPSQTPLSLTRRPAGAAWASMASPAHPAPLRWATSTSTGRFPTGSPNPVPRPCSRCTSSAPRASDWEACLKRPRNHVSVAPAMGGDGRCLPVRAWPFGVDRPPFPCRAGVALEPQNKIGPNAGRRAACGELSERVGEHRATARRNAERLADCIAKDRRWLLSLS